MSKVIQPKLRFPEFKDHWKIKKFNELFSFRSTNSLSRENLNYNSGIVKNIHYGDIHTKFESHFDVKKERVPYINPEIDLSKISQENFLKEGDLVIADASEDYNDIGKSIEIIDLNNEKVLAGLHTFLARKESKDLYTGFPTFLLKTRKVRLDIMKIAQGTKVLSLSSSRLGEISLDIPSYEEQNKIAEFLTSVEKYISLLKSKKTTLERYKTSVMQQIFSQKIRFKDENGNDFPDWVDVNLGDECIFFSGGTPTSTNKKYYTGDIPFIGSGEINNDVTEKKITQSALENSSSKIIEKGDILYALYGATSGEVAISKIDGAINQAVLCIRPTKMTRMQLDLWRMMNY